MKIKYLLFAFVLILVSCSNTDPGSSYWTRFRGADGLGVDKYGQAPAAWDESDFLWNITLPGVGNASPVVWGRSIFVSSADHETETGYLLAIDSPKGDILWQQEFPIGELSMHRDNKLAAQSPAVDKSQVYVIWYSKEKTTLIALSHKGQIKWQSEFEGIVSRHGGGSSLSLTENLVVFTREQEDFSTLKSSWVAVDKKTGSTVWEVERESPENNSFATPLLVDADQKDAQLIFASQSHGLTGVDPETGSVLWELKDVFPSRVVGSPFYTDGKIIVNINGEALVFELDPLTKQVEDSALYTLPRTLSPYVPTPIAVGDLLFTFMDNGTVACLRLATGELLWKERPAGAIYGSPICVNGMLYCTTKEGKVIVMEAASTYQLLGISDLGEGSFSTPVMCGSGMVFRTFTQLLLLGSKEG